jgi:hypothetical protein
MIISVDVDYPVSNKSLLIEICFPANIVLLDLSQDIKTLLLEFKLPIQKQTIDLKFCCKDLRIVDHPLTITNIVLDDFYQSDSILYRGCPEFDQQFLLLSDQKKIYLDFDVSDSNRLDFTGNLVYKFIWPFYKNVF